MPAPRKPRPDATLSGQLRGFIADCGLSAYALAEESGVDRAALSRFLSGKADLKLESADKLAAVLGLRLAETLARGRGRPRAARAAASPRQEGRRRDAEVPGQLDDLVPGQ